MLETRLGARIVASRLLMLQSKQLVLMSAQRRLPLRSTLDLKARLARLRLEVESALSSYRSSVLKWGSPDYSQFSQVAYSRMIELAESAVDELRMNIGSLRPNDRYEIAVEVEGLELLIDRWRLLNRKAMIAEVA